MTESVVTESSGQVDFASRETLTPPRLVLVAQEADTTRPAIPGTDFPADTLFVVSDPATTKFEYYRRLAMVSFLPSATGTEIRAFLAKFDAVVVGGSEFL